MCLPSPGKKTPGSGAAPGLYAAEEEDQFAAIQSVVTQVGCQGPHPGSKGAFLVISGEMVMCSHESVLNQVFSILPVSKDTVANVEHRGLVDLN